MYLCVLKSRDNSLLTKVYIVKALVFPVEELWELAHKEGREPNNWNLLTVVLEKTPESPLDSKEIKPVNFFFFFCLFPPFIYLFF